MTQSPRTNTFNQSHETPYLIAVYGASNVTVSLPTVVAAAYNAALPPWEILVGHGPGRSYGTVAGCFLYTYPGLLKSGLLDHCRRFRTRYPHGRIDVLLTDIGNDLALSGQNRALHFWLERLLTGLAALDARIAVTALPVASVHAMPRWKFNILRHIYFPFADTGFAQIQTLVQETQSQLEQWAAAGRFTLLAGQQHWYTIDHFHLGLFARKRVIRAWAASLVGRAETVRKPAASAWQLRRLPLKRYWRMRTRRYPAQAHLDLGPNCRLFYY